MSKKVLVAMSGGVDSSVAAFLLKKEGYQVTGVFLNFWKEKPSLENKCCSTQSKKDARKVARQLGIAFMEIDYSQLFKERVVNKFIEQQLAGKTPNPCVVCNKFIKLGDLLIKSRQLGFDFLATGHYLRVKKQVDCWRVFKAIDPKKDQSYFLYNLNQVKLKHLLFPIGEFTKSQVKVLAKKNGIITYNQPESQDICFIPDSDTIGFLQRNARGFRAGPIIDQSGDTIGRHRGLPFYTIGQREGLGVGGSNGPYYVVAKKVSQNKLVVTNDQKSDELWQDQLSLKNVNWITGTEPKLPYKTDIKIRYNSPSTPGVIIRKGGIKIQFSKQVRAITPGQSAVFYKNQELVGGGIIT
ncbi:MAG: tRNA 2-thiouridine(34) synthase MnmA [Patescibacteria group bacterium]